MKRCSSVSFPWVTLLLTVNLLQESPSYSSSSSKLSTRAMYFNSLDLPETKTTTWSPMCVSAFFSKYSLTVCLLNAVARPIDAVSRDLMDKLCHFLTPNHHCLPAFLVSCQEFATLKSFLQQIRMLAAYIFTNDKPQYMSAEQLMWLARFFLLELFCGEDLLKHMQLHNLDPPASFSYSANVSFCRPQNYQQLFGVTDRFVFRTNLAGTSTTCKFLFNTVIK